MRAATQYPGRCADRFRNDLLTVPDLPRRNDVVAVVALVNLRNDVLTVKTLAFFTRSTRAAGTAFG
jgi:hypothetical protein